MVKVRNRVVLFSHHDGSATNFLQLVKSKVKEEVRREEMEIKQGGVRMRG
jgi:hypothetical protein